jgi:hypothetical protein
MRRDNVWNLKLAHFGTRSEALTLSGAMESLYLTRQASDHLLWFVKLSNKNQGGSHFAQRIEMPPCIKTVFNCKVCRSPVF